jgi:amidohydrolase
MDCESLEAVGWRRSIHAHPELAFAEHRTASLVAAKLEDFGLSVHRGLGGTGVVGSLRRGDGPTIGIRADMDALPITEDSGVSHASSVSGIMHACGHDGHTAILLAAAQACARIDGLRGTVHFIFQPAEEGEGGGRAMVEQGLFEQFPCDEIYALHNWPALPVGTFVARDGAMMAALSLFEIELTGQGCHAAMPHQGTDVLLAASHIVTSLQSIASRFVDPQQAAIVSVTQINGGSSFNALPDSCLLRGTTRWLDEDVGNVIETRLKDIANRVAQTYGCAARVHYDRRMPVTTNDPKVAARARRVGLSPPVGLKHVDSMPTMASEDFAFMLNERPGCYLLLGSARGANEPMLHSPRFDFNDALIPIGASLWVSIVQDVLLG